LTFSRYYLNLVFVQLDRRQLEILSECHLAWTILLGAREKLLLDILLQLRVLPLILLTEFLDIHHDHVVLLKIAM
jgi:hypothetical protein